MTAPGEGYRYGFAMFSFLYLTIVAIVANVMLYMRRNFQPVKTWHPVLLSAITWHLPIRFAMIEFREMGWYTVPCNALISMEAFQMMGLAVPLVMLFYRLLLISDFEQKKVDFAKKFLAGGGANGGLVGSIPGVVDGVDPVSGEKSGGGLSPLHQLHNGVAAGGTPKQPMGFDLPNAAPDFPGTTVTTTTVPATAATNGTTAPGGRMATPPQARTSTPPPMGGARTSTPPGAMRTSLAPPPASAPGAGVVALTIAAPTVASTMTVAAPHVHGPNPSPRATSSKSSAATALAMANELKALSGINVRKMWLVSCSWVALTVISTGIFVNVDKNVDWKHAQEDQCGYFNSGLILLVVQLVVAYVFAVYVLVLFWVNRNSVTEAFGMRRAFSQLFIYGSPGTGVFWILMLSYWSDKFRETIWDPFYLQFYLTYISIPHLIIYQSYLTYHWKTKGGRQRSKSPQNTTNDSAGTPPPRPTIGTLTKTGGAGDDASQGSAPKKYHVDVPERVSIIGSGSIGAPIPNTPGGGGEPNAATAAAQARRSAILNGSRPGAPQGSPGGRQTNDRQSIALVKVLLDPVGYAKFVEYAQSEFNAESVLFWSAVEQYRLNPTVDTAARIFATFLADTAPMELNLSFQISQRIRDDVNQMLTRGFIGAAAAAATAAGQPPRLGIDDSSAPDPTLFDLPQREVFLMMRSDVFPRFRISKLGEGISHLWADIPADASALGVRRSATGLDGVGPARTTPQAGGGGGAATKPGNDRKSPRTGVAGSSDAQSGLLGGATPIHELVARRMMAGTTLGERGGSSSGLLGASSRRKTGAPNAIPSGQFRSSPGGASGTLHAVASSPLDSSARVSSRAGTTTATTLPPPSSSNVPTPTAGATAADVAAAPSTAPSVAPSPAAGPTAPAASCNIE